MEPTYSLITSEAGYRLACGTVIARAEHELLIFDRNLAAPRLDEKPVLDRLTAFLSPPSVGRIRIAMREPDQLCLLAPRLALLFARYSHRIDIRQTPDTLSHLADTHIIADGKHAIRRFQFDQPRCAQTLDDPDAIHPWQQRFEELWELSQACQAVNVSGL